ncbi:class I SAM-dependent methyltransferase [Williamsia muralis]|uniref:Class I SAM-dependent methyltransferase n=1 Tax=Williamsia marianensis TaxID=85044 RepID=A0ABU4EPB0_WILMA|nr:class I SAM-dependent methyltransferase [Williamsia muralis]MDV7133070.1 class I SAM-dependent methyltransferase [Williamsia muralis]
MRQIDRAIGDAVRVLDVGAGTGSYEPTDRTVVAVEPSRTMIEQRAPGSAPVVQAVAQNLPFVDGQFDVAMAVLTVHHWADVDAGIAELRRVSRRQLVLTYDPKLHARFWLCDYIPEIAYFELDRAPTVERLTSLLESQDIRTLRVPADMRDGVLTANWQQPQAYLDPAVRACCSGLAQLDQDAVDAGIRQLSTDIADGTWARRYGHLNARPDYDGGYRLIVAEP